MMSKFTAITARFLSLFPLRLVSSSILKLGFSSYQCKKYEARH